MFTTYTKADQLSNEVTTFWAKSVGANINSMEEFSLLAEWHDAITAAQSLALSLRDWVSVDDYDAMLEECQMWLSHVG